MKCVVGFFEEAFLWDVWIWWNYCFYAFREAAGGLRDPHGSFMEVVMNPKLELRDIFQIQCKLKDICFAYNLGMLLYDIVLICYFFWSFEKQCAQKSSFFFYILRCMNFLFTRTIQSLTGFEIAVLVEVYKDKVCVFHSGLGINGSDGNSIVKWEKMGASVQRTSKKLAIGGKTPYLTPFFGMFGYGGTIASMHLGRHAVVSAKTKQSKTVYWRHLQRNAL
ncbi:uncharacterized protein LOC130589415 [Beta vulgaris subsp. vulgaris]|uniref:uncharacterized protein LOC130589415 n=1 Tax=Beta vulgaris subsp. vulgaris TaxID=3555 RepID=UPI002548D0A1|nr:uncharacterized protein LOC130589415 [Beta vulgaris subsp. vulgaris]